jgi:hypothetical protein
MSAAEWILIAVFFVAWFWRAWHDDADARAERERQAATRAELERLTRPQRALRNVADRWWWHS